jgi:hypothetical protein
MRHMSALGRSIRPLAFRRKATLAMSEIVTAELIYAARAVIADMGCTLLLIERTVRLGRTSIRIDAVHADGSRAKGIARCGDTAMREVCHAANATLRQLAAMLPVGSGNAVGLMTDGTGAAFSPDHVSAVRGDWFSAVLSGDAFCIDLARFDPAGRWGQLVAQHHGGRAH